MPTNLVSPWVNLSYSPFFNTAKREPKGRKEKKVVTSQKLSHRLLPLVTEMTMPCSDPGLMFVCVVSRTVFWWLVLE
jgi:hypothetical protein